MSDDVKRRIDSDVRKTVDFLQTLKRKLFSDCPACGDTGRLEDGRYCTCKQGALVIEGELVIERPKNLMRPKAPELHASSVIERPVRLLPASQWDQEKRKKP